MGHQTASALSKKLGTQVEVGKVDIGLLNRVIIDDFELYDQQDKKMLSATRLSAKVDIPSLLKGKVSVSSAQLFGMKANLYRETAEAPFNFQFVIDSLSSKEQKEKKPLDLNINSLIIRNGAVNYDQLDAPCQSGTSVTPAPSPDRTYRAPDALPTHGQAHRPEGKETRLQGILRIRPPQTFP